MKSSRTLERHPLLHNDNGSIRSSYSSTGETKDTKHELGPLEILPSARHQILLGIWLAQFLSALNLTLVPTMLASISSEFNSSNQASWLGTSYLLATCTFTPLYGRLCDILGRNRASQLAISSASIGIFCCGLSTQMEWLVAARFLSGLGGGGIFTTSSIITSDMYDLRSRSFVQSIGGIFYGLGMGLGGPIGGIVTDYLGWRWAFLLQIPFFALAWALVAMNLSYVLLGSGKSMEEILRRIDYGGTFTLFGATFTMVLFFSMRYNEGREWGDPFVWLTLLLSCVFFLLFITTELYIAVEPILPPHLLTHKVPVLVGCSNALVAVCNLSVTYFFPTWFQTVKLTSASTAGLHLLPNSICISTGSIFAGWMMRRTGRYKTMNLTFGILPFVGALLLTCLREDSGWVMTWLSIIPLGFGNAVVLQTLYIALVGKLDESQMAVGTGFAQLLRGLGQVGGLTFSSALFQSTLDTTLRKSITGPDADDIINHIRHSARSISTLPPHIQRIAQDSYATSLRSVFVLAACASLLAFMLRLPIPDRDLSQRRPAELREGEEDFTTPKGSVAA